MSPIHCAMPADGARSSRILPCLCAPTVSSLGGTAVGSHQLEALIGILPSRH